MKYSKGKGLGKDSRSMYHLWEFDHVRDVVALAATNEAPEVSNDWDGNMNLTKDLGEAIDMFRDGWHDIRDMVDGTLEPLREELGRILSVETVRVHDMCGFEPDIDRYLAGELECMWDDMMVEAPKDGKVFRMLVDCSMTWNNRPADIAKRGAALCALVEACIILGFQMEIWVEHTVKSPTKEEWGTVLAKVCEAGEPMDIDTTMFVIGHPDFNRRILWATGELDDVRRETFGFRRGSCYGYCRQGSHYADKVGASVVVTLDGNNVLTYKPMDWILDQLEAQGIYSREGE